MDECKQLLQDILTAMQRTADAVERIQIALLGED